MIKKAKVQLEVELELDLESPMFDDPVCNRLSKDFETLAKGLGIRPEVYEPAYDLWDGEALTISCPKVIRISKIS